MNLLRHRQRLIAAAPIIFVLLWSTGYLSSRIIRPYVEPLTFSALRYAAATVIFICLVYLRRATWPQQLSAWWHLSVCGILIQGFFITGMMVAVTGGLDMGIAALVGGMQPILTALFAVAWLKESVTKIQSGGFLFGFVGLAMVLSESLNVGNIALPSLLLSVIAVLGITFGTIYQKRFVTSVDLLSGTAVQFAAACIPVSILAWCFEAGNIVWNLPVVATAVWLVGAPNRSARY